MADNEDFKRAWFDERDFGILFQAANLQSAISSSMWMDVDNTKEKLKENALISFAQSFQNKAVLSPISKCHRYSKEIIMGHTLNSLLIKDHQLESRSNISTHSLNDTINFLTDALSLESMNFNNLTNESPIASSSSETKQNDIRIRENVKLLSNFKSGNCRTDSTNAIGEATVALHPIDIYPEDNWIQSQQNSKNNNNNNSNIRSSTQSSYTNINQFQKEGGVLKKAKTTDSNQDDSNNNNQSSHESNNKSIGYKRSSSSSGKDKDNKNQLPPELQHCEVELVEKIESDIIQHGQPVTFEDIAGLEFAKKCVQELICWPMLRPDIFTGLRSVPRGLLLFGPPGTGKTLIGKAIAHQAGATFFCISASSLTSKWIGEGEKAVKTLFAVAVYRQPSVIFIDEVDSLLCQRSAEENESSRRIKTEFLVQLDGAGTDQNARVVVIGATNRPEELDEAARRRFVKRIYIPLPDSVGRKDMFIRLLRSSQSVHSVPERDIDELVEQTAGYSEAAMGPVREIAVTLGNLSNMRAEDVPPISTSHFKEALEVVAPSVSTSDLTRYIEWNSQFGSYRRME
eukprot:gene5058-10128_t